MQPHHDNRTSHSTETTATDDSSGDSNWMVLVVALVGVLLVGAGLALAVIVVSDAVALPSLP